MVFNDLVSGGTVCALFGGKCVARFNILGLLVIFCGIRHTTLVTQLFLVQLLDSV